MGFCTSQDYGVPLSLGVGRNFSRLTGILGTKKGESWMQSVRGFKGKQLVNLYLQCTDIGTKQKQKTEFMIDSLSRNKD